MSHRRQKIMTSPSDTPTPSKRFHQWSEVHDIKKQRTQLAEINILPSRFQISGPPELVIQTQTIVQIMDGQDSDAIKSAIMEEWSKWHVICCVTGDKILLCDVRYWDMDGLIYSDPYLIPENCKPVSPGIMT